MKRKKVRVVRGDEKYPFSLGEVVEALQGAGVPTDDAIRIARDAEKQVRSRQKNVPLEDLVALLTDRIHNDLGPDVATRFAVRTPPFVPLRVVRGGAAEPFSRRNLAASLERLGLDFKVGHAVARQVEQSLRSEGYEEVGERELGHAVAVSVEALVGREARNRYEATQQRVTDLMVTEPDGTELPFSRGVLARSVMATGLDAELAHSLAKRVESHLWRQGSLCIDRTYLRYHVTRILTELAGEEYAQRYQLLHTVRRLEQPIIILVGGAPGVGKSSAASELAYRLGIPRLVSTDAVRQALRSLISIELSPTLHTSSYTAWKVELLPGEEASKPKRKRVIRGFLAQVQQLDAAVRAIIGRHLDESLSVVMEGIHLVPGICPSTTFPDAVVIELVLGVADEEDHRRHFGLREQQSRSRQGYRTYLEHFPEIRVLQEFIEGRAEEEDVPVIDATDLDRAVDEALDFVLDTLRHELLDDEVAPEQVAAAGTATTEGGVGEVGATQGAAKQDRS